MRGALAAALAAASACAAPISLQLHHREAPLRRRTTETGDLSNAAPLFQGFGTHFVYVWVGTPPQRVSVIVDTGSHITAFPCQGNSENCKDCGTHTDAYFNTTASSTFKKLGAGECVQGHYNSGAKECRMSQSYAEGSRWDAYEAQDKFYVGGEFNEDGVGSNRTFDFKFGCQTHETGLFITQLADGIMGMDMHANTLVYKLNDNHILDSKSFSMCFKLGGGIMNLGLPDPRIHLEDMQYVPLRQGSWFTVTVDEVRIGDERVDTPASTWSRGKGMIVDSGTTDTYLPKGCASAFRKAWEAAAGAKFTNSAVELTAAQLAALPAITFTLTGNGDAKLSVSMQPGDYMERQTSNDRMNDKYICRIYLDEPVGGVLGANFMRGHDVHFDVSKMKIGFARANCEYSEIPTLVSRDCTLSDWLPVGSCNGTCANATADAQGKLKFERVVNQTLQGSGKDCPEGDRVEWRPCERNCTNPVVEHTLPPTFAPMDYGACVPNFEWTTCSNACKETRDLSDRAEDGGCETWTRDCHTGFCDNWRGFKLEMQLLFTDVDFEKWGRDVEDGIEERVAELFTQKDSRDIAVTYARPVTSTLCETANIVQVVITASFVAQKPKGSWDFDDGAAYAALQKAEDLSQATDFGDELRVALNKTFAWEKGAQGTLITTKVMSVGGAFIPGEGGGGGVRGGMGAALIALTVLSVITAVTALVFACIYHRRLRFELRRKGRSLMARMNPHMQAHKYTKVQMNDGVTYGDGEDFEDGIISDRDLGLADT